MSVLEMRCGAIFEGYQGPGRLSRVFLYSLGATVALCFSAPAVAYVGPGAGLAFIGSVIAVVLAVVIALVGIVLFPLRMLIKAIRRPSKTDTDAAPLSRVDQEPEL